MAPLKLPCCSRPEKLSDAGRADWRLQLSSATRLHLVYCQLATCAQLPLPGGCLWPREVQRLSVLTMKGTTAKEAADQAGSQCPRMKDIAATLHRHSHCNAGYFVELKHSF